MCSAEATRYACSRAAAVAAHTGLLPVQCWLQELGPWALHVQATHACVLTRQWKQLTLTRCGVSSSKQSSSFSSGCQAGGTWPAARWWGAECRTSRDDVPCWLNANCRAILPLGAICPQHTQAMWQGTALPAAKKPAYQLHAVPAGPAAAGARHASGWRPRCRTGSP